MILVLRPSPVNILRRHRHHQSACADGDWLSKLLSMLCQSSKLWHPPLTVLLRPSQAFWRAKHVVGLLREEVRGRWEALYGEWGQKADR